VAEKTSCRLRNVGGRHPVHPVALGEVVCRRAGGGRGIVRGVGLALLLGTSLSSTACVTYVEVDAALAPEVEEVRVRLTDEGAVRAARHLGRFRTEFDAAVALRPPDSVTVIVWLGKNYPGTQFEDVRETIVLPRHEVSDIHLRRLSAKRTAAALVGAAAVFALLVDQIFLQEDPNRPPEVDDENPPPAGFRLLRIPIG